jgi:8-hydroxy-5-deazaflavin:NADPH oxidoreductase
MSPVNVAVIGTGNIGGTVGQALARAGHQVVFGSRAATAGGPSAAAGAAGAAGASGASGARTTGIGEAIAAADVVLVAIPAHAVEDFAREYGAALDGKLVLDAANRFGAPAGTPAHNAAAYAEHAPGSRYARVFNTLGVEILADPDIGGTLADMFFSCPPADRAVVETLVSAVGLRPVYVGADQHDVVDGVLRLWVALAIGQKRGRHLAFRTLTP